MKKTGYNIALKRPRKNVSSLDYLPENTWLEYLRENKDGWEKDPSTFFYPELPKIGPLRRLDTVVSLLGVYYRAGCCGH